MLICKGINWKAITLVMKATTKYLSYITKMKTCYDSQRLPLWITSMYIFQHTGLTLEKISYPYLQNIKSCIWLEVLGGIYQICKGKYKTVLSPQLVWTVGSLKIVKSSLWSSCVAFYYIDYIRVRGVLKKRFLAVKASG